ncbi:MAG: MBL fold metallo-hydrolase [Oscillospiraceae bacterium]|nr:MBL fold metallo-hydrolase [Oscillospiraceae bacterium]
MLLIDFINVGSGDSILIRENAPNGKQFVMLIDCGDVDVGEAEVDSKRITSADFLLNEGVDKIDLLVLTHLHLDHAGGLTRLLSKANVTEFWCNYIPERKLWGETVVVPDGYSEGARRLLTSLNVFSAALNEMSDHGVTIRRFNAEESSFVLGKDIHGEAFSEKEATSKQEEVWQLVFDGQATADDVDALNLLLNDASLRMRLTYAGHSVELPGDFSSARWERLQQPRCSIVKLPHHGHADSLTERLASMLSAEYVVVSVANNRTDGFPAKETMELAKRYSPHYLYTDAVKFPGLTPLYHESVRFSISGDGELTCSTCSQSQT